MIDNRKWPDNYATLLDAIRGEVTLEDVDIENLVNLTGKGCQEKTKKKLESQLRFRVRDIDENQGHWVLGRVIYTKDTSDAHWEYYPYRRGSRSSVERAALRELIIGE